MKNGEFKYAKINRGNIGLFVATEYKRAMRPAHVASLKADLRRDASFKQPIHVNKVGNQVRIIDGNHRIDAVRELLKDNDATIEVPVIYYEDLTIDEEKQLYDVLSKQVNQSIDDAIRIHADGLKIMRMLEKFPIGLRFYHRKDAIKYSTLFLVYLDREDANSQGIKRNVLIPTLAKMDSRDYDRMREFFEGYKVNFGLPSDSNPYYKRYVLWLIESIYFKNIGVMEKEKFWQHLKAKLYDNVMILDLAKSNNKVNATDTRAVVVAKLNAGWRGNKFV